MKKDFEHKTVLLHEAVEELVVNPDGVYFDGTFGRGGHSRLILSMLSERGRLIATDKDPEAIAEGKLLEQDDSRFEIVHGSFADIGVIASDRGIQFSGMLLDLGVSSPQLDDASRGFSFLNDGPLDMRMNPSADISAAEWINSADEKDIADVIFKYGEEKFSRRMAKAIVLRRQDKEFETTADLAEVIKQANPAWEKNKHPATRAFQAIRIFINRELQDLEGFLDASADTLTLAGRMVIISFHSLEDRIVKRFIQKEEKGDMPEGLPVTADMISSRFKRIGKQRKPGKLEVEQNPRARSAVMRIAERT